MVFSLNLDKMSKIDILNGIQIRIICSLKGILWKQRLHQRTETRVCIFPGPD